MRRHVIYAGRVQGVGFRATVASIARSHPVRGFVCNRPDGTVELVAEGDAPVVNDFLKAVAAQFERNIRSARNEEFVGDETFDSFRIRH